MPVETEIDRLHLSRAIELAEGGRGSVSPNPLVGAVLGRHDEVVGEGFHRALGGPHAEVEAIRDSAGADLSGVTLYISLEPCCHQGRTPPCTEAILEAGIGRVVVAADDPSKHASGRGLGILRDEGVEVVVADDDLALRARLQNQPFRKHARTGRPFVLFKSAMTLDGKVATRTGDSKWISGQTSRELAHLWRSECDAVAVGIGTVLVDDPRLNARIPSAVRQPRRIVFDSTARLPLGSQLVKGARQDPLTVVVSRAAPRTATNALRAHGADVVVATGENETARIRSALDQLGAAGITSLLLEGGPHLAGAFFDAHEIDQVRLFLAPLMVGGKGARQSVEGEGAEVIGEAMRAHDLTCDRVDNDLLVTARIREW
jgi:diaminohydroxyphosphoribosylaminopyrimidine deaminase/5-amino-6-(5-phosphoribosylamino)uracil reductase